MNDFQISIVSKNEIVREGLRRILVDQSFTVHQAVGEVAELADDAPPPPGEELVLVDSNSFGEGIAICRQLRAKFMMMRIVLMADEYSIENVALAFNAGVDGYLIKAISCEPLGGALRLIAMGEKVFPSQIADSLLDPAWRTSLSSWRTGSEGHNLSAREVEILRCLVSGEANKVISRRLAITEATVKVHIKAILRKLRVTNRTQAAIWAVTRGLGKETKLEPASPAAAFQNQEIVPLQVA
jgi:two-component system nitrate/nitrite response regulator NarL